MKIDFERNLELIKKMQTWRGFIFTRKKGSPLYSLEFKITKDEIENFAKRMSEESKEEKTLDRKKELYIYGQLQTFPRYWVTTKKDNKQNFILSKNKFENEILHLLPKRTINIPLNNMNEKFNEGEYHFLLKENSEENCRLDIYNKKIKSITSDEIRYTVFAKSPYK